ncbi:MAG: hypothetical protein H6Q00_1252 [Holophagaceae bacterium]|nr:hypothetical protein [Holophagaceae bacterium]
MLERDSQTLTISRQGLLLVTAMGVGLLTLVYVLGVQVGKQSASLRRASSKASGEDLMELPAPLAEQLKPFEANAAAEKPAPKAETSPQPTPTEAPKPEPKKEEAKKEEPKAPAKPEPAGKWSVQLVSTTDAAEASRVAAKAKAAGYATVIVKDRTLHKVRLSKATSKEAADAAAKAVKAKGFKPFPVKVD